MHDPLFASCPLGDLTLPNRMVMAPLTRGRAQPDGTPTDLMVEYYRQRATAGLIITEATHISSQGQGWYCAPGIHEPAHVEGWKKVTRAVHTEGGRIFLQLWHMGRASHSDFHDGALSVSSSALALQGEITTPVGRKAHETPRALELNELPGIVEQYASATRLAREAGFDGVEIHAANGYLLDQFLRNGCNQRTDAYGGSIANRCRLMLEVTEAVIGAWSADRVGIRFSPTGEFQGMSDSDPQALFTGAARMLETLKPVYIHTMEPLPGHQLAGTRPRVTPAIREIFSGILISNGGFDAAEANRAISAQETDLVAFGVPFIANPDLVERYRLNAPLNPPDPATFYSHGAKGYTDYPALG